MTTPPRPSPAQRLHALRTDGRLAAHWPEVAPLLAEATDPGTRDSAEALRELLACGRILAAVDPAEILARHPGTPLATITLTGHAAPPDLRGPLAAELARHGMPLRLVTGEHGSYLRDLSDPGGQLSHVRPDLTLCLLDAGAVFDELTAPWSLEDAESACARLAARLRAVAAAHARHGRGTLVLNTLPLLRHHTHQLTDERRRAQLSAIWRDLNAGLLRLAATCPRLAAVDLDPLIAETGPARDARTATRPGTPFTDALVAAYAREVGHLLRARRGPARTCLVLDGALWAGLVGEEPGGPGGAPNAALRSTLRQLAAQGVLLAVTGRGDPAPDHRLPAAGVREIAGRLGVDADGLVLAAPGENAPALAHLPATAVISLGDDPALHVERLLQDSWFTTPPPTHRPDDTTRHTPLHPTGDHHPPDDGQTAAHSPRTASSSRPPEASLGSAGGRRLPEGAEAAARSSCAAASCGPPEVPLGPADERRPSEASLGSAGGRRLPDGAEAAARSPRAASPSRPLPDTPSRPADERCPSEASLGSAGGRRLPDGAEAAARGPRAAASSRPSEVPLRPAGERRPPEDVEAAARGPRAAASSRPSEVPLRPAGERRPPEDVEAAARSPRAAPPSRPLAPHPPRAAASRPHEATSHVHMVVRPAPDGG
ncbi:hypothetical protein [Streptomyces sp. KL118A]|uniref:hypothetical protein n=1 Tax=Streptomyces sp. KL118A TaxID=3045153 RepID=UPI00278C60CF|nr:hypothetical protein [Streptomyces sp. KL118A]